jgi:hypothetical protein
MNVILTLDEIKTQFRDEWVLLGEPEESEDLEIVRGQVLFHSPNADDTYRKAAELSPGRFATVFTGEIPADIDFVL